MTIKGTRQLLFCYIPSTVVFLILTLLRMCFACRLITYGPCVTGHTKYISNSEL